ncbi:MAG TPA: DivIVA domain-containing protein [Mycobacteriales bacterium]|jgi:DivIVA domain-containing protein|nr:DivIVA domain-containing protein [Mycobacteriales bacterium]
MAYGYSGPPAARRPEQRVGAADVRSVQFGKPPFGRRGYDEIEVDDFLRKVADTLGNAPNVPRVTPDEVHEIAFRKPRIGSRGYDEDEVDAFLDLVELELRWRGSPDGQREQAAQFLGAAGARAVQTVAVALLVDRGRLLVAELPDPVSGRTVYRPPGGEIAFGERGHETVRRALREDFGIALAEVQPLATLESIHRFAGREGHELVLVYEAAPSDPAVWAQQRLMSRRGDASAVWAPVDLFRRGEAPLLPDGLLPLLE